MADLNENAMFFSPKESRPLPEVRQGYTCFANDDVLLAKVTPCFENGKAGIAKDLESGLGFGSSEYYVLRPDQSKILPEYLYLNIANNRMKRSGKPAMTGTGGLQRLPKSYIENYEIPLPPLETQKKIVSEFTEEQEIVESNKKLIGICKRKIQLTLREI